MTMPAEVSGPQRHESVRRWLVLATAAYHAGMSSESLAEELIRVEQRGWEALCSGDAVSYYRQHLTEDALMAFPFGVMEREEALRAMAGAEPWSRYHMANPKVIRLSSDSGVVVYQVTAQREGQELFSAVLSSTFVRQDGDWKLAFHQQSFR
jgi:hypothetical protein